MIEIKPDYLAYVSPKKEGVLEDQITKYSLAVVIAKLEARGFGKDTLNNAWPTAWGVVVNLSPTDNTFFENLKKPTLFSGIKEKEFVYQNSTEFGENLQIYKLLLGSGRINYVGISPELARALLEERRRIYETYVSSWEKFAAEFQNQGTRFP